MTITGAVIVADPYPPGNQGIAITAATTAPGSNCPAGHHRPARARDRRRCRSPALSIANAASTSTPVPGSVVGYTLTITDTGQTAYTGVTVTDSVAQMLDDVAYDGDAAATAGSISYAAGSSPGPVTWPPAPPPPSPSPSP